MNKEIMHRVLFFSRVSTGGKTKILKNEYKKLEEELDLLSSLINHLVMEAPDEKSFVLFNSELELLLDMNISFQKSAIRKMMLEERSTADDGACSKEGH